MMAKWKFLVICLATAIFSDVNFQSLADDDGGLQRGINDPEPFRLNKLNMMWEKAKKTLSEKKLPALYAEFVIQDRREIDLKQRKVEGADPNGEEEAELRHRFLDILKRFDLRSKYSEDTLPGTAHATSNSNTGPDDDAIKKALSSDPKLAKLWKKAEQAGFSDDELAVLRAEFGHHVDKLNEYEEMRQQIDHLEEMNNSIEKFKQETDNSIDEKVDIREKHAELKKVYKDLKHSYNSLKEMTEDQTRQPQQLKDLRVRELWRLAQTSNMTGDELSSFKTELEHFERRIHKHEFFEKEVEMSRAALQLKKKFHDTEVPEEHKKLESKVKSLGSKVKKWYSELKNRLLKKSTHSDEL